MAGEQMTTTADTVSFFDIAVRLIESGFSVIPRHPRSKDFLNKLSGEVS
jgi:hypothetical protein